MWALLHPNVRFAGSSELLSDPRFGCIRNPPIRLYPIFYPQNFVYPNFWIYPKFSDIYPNRFNRNFGYPIPSNTGLHPPLYLEIKRQRIVLRQPLKPLYYNLHTLLSTSPTQNGLNRLTQHSCCNFSINQIMARMDLIFPSNAFLHFQTSKKWT